ncbi:adhesin [Bacillus sp. M6-12]|uniref:metal ABC transporter solute-binding protein, Zn/Mn family n=1 Tax=Bacillus sp. M6-12 TaxID=2054166 RepID=UPI000C7879FC|nr:zinc ABC transporter substrate-binding protein [Bacillus sp. M6-12]PLS14954.1 adhesin [Bacillus sp. M6-12]
MKMRLLLAIILSAAVGLAGCGTDQKNEKAKLASKNDKLQIYTTVFPLEDFTEKIGGKFVDVHTIYPPGSDEHTFEPSQKDIIGMAESDLFLYVGHNLEGFVNKARPILEEEGVTMLAVGEKLKIEAAEETHEHSHEGHSDDEKHGHEDKHPGDHTSGDGHNHGDIDPHLWIDPVYSIEMAKIITNQLSKEYPEQSAYFEENYDNLAQQLDELHHRFESTIKSAKKDQIIVSHSAYGYWEKRYGLEQISISGLASTSEPSQKELEEIVQTAKKNDIQYIIFEQNISSKLTKIVQKEIGAKPLKLHNLSVLTEKEQASKEDYFSLMDKNLKTLEKALN